jgi:hypothetical protein
VNATGGNPSNVLLAQADDALGRGLNGLVATFVRVAKLAVMVHAKAKDVAALVEDEGVIDSSRDLLDRGAKVRQAFEREARRSGLAESVGIVKTGTTAAYGERTCCLSWTRRSAHCCYVRR